MPQLPHQARQQRVAQLAYQWGITKPIEPSPLVRPAQPFSFRTPSEDQTADEQLRRFVAEKSQGQQKNGLARAFSSGNSKKFNPKDILAVLDGVVRNGGSPGVAEALIARLEADGVDMVGLQRKSSMLVRRKSYESSFDRTSMIRSAVERTHFDMLQVLLPHADQYSLDIVLPIAINTASTPTVELLLRYGGNVSQTSEGVAAFRNACVNPAQADVVALILQTEGRPLPTQVSEALIDATRAGSLRTVQVLVRSTADTNYYQAEALRTAVGNGHRDIVVAIISGKKPPQQPGLDDAFAILKDHSSLSPIQKLEMGELLLCAGANGEVLSHTLQLACSTQWMDMVDLLAAYGVSLEYKEASVVRDAINKGDLNLLSRLLTPQTTLSAPFASNSVACILPTVPNDFRYAVLTLLLEKGARGQALHECLIQAAKTGDTASVNLLLNPNYPNLSSPQQTRGQRMARNAPTNHEVASVDYQSGAALTEAMVHGDLDLVQAMLLARPSRDTLSAVLPSTLNLPTPQRYAVAEMLLKETISPNALSATLTTVVSVAPASRDSKMIDILIKHGVVVDDASLQSAVLHGDSGLVSKLARSISASTAAKGIPCAMQVKDSGARFSILQALFAQGGSIGTHETGTALLIAVDENPPDMNTLRLILEQGRPDVLKLGDALIKKIMECPNPAVLGLVLGNVEFSDNVSRCCLEHLAPLPSTESKAQKLEMVLSKSSRDLDLKDILSLEVQGLLERTSQKTSLSTLKRLLDAGADPNSYGGASLCRAVEAAKSTITDLLLQGAIPPNTASLSHALPFALRISDAGLRLAFAKRLVGAGAPPAEINRALVWAIKTFPEDKDLVICLAKAADTSDGEALLLPVAAESHQMFQVLLEHSRHTEEKRDTALGTAMTIKKRSTRYSICKDLLTAGCTSQATSLALLLATRSGDIDLCSLLVSFGASTMRSDGQSIMEACRAGRVEVLEVLLKVDLDTETPILERGFQAATEVRDLNKRAAIFQRLLRKGKVRQDIVDHQLTSATRFGDEGKEVLRVLLAEGADPNFNNGESVYHATRSAFIGNLELLLGLWKHEHSQKKASDTTLNRALDAAWPLERETRYKIIQDLVAAELPVTEDLHKALNNAVNEEHPEDRLVKLLLGCKASPLANSCKSIIDASTNVAPGILRLLLEQPIPQADITHAFSQAFCSDSFSRWFSTGGLDIAQMLLAKGATGDGLNGALTLVMTGATDGNAELANQFVECLIAGKVDVNFDNGAPLWKAASRANARWVRQLLALHPSMETLSSGFQHIFDTSLPEEDALTLFRLFSEYREGDVSLDSAVITNSSSPVLANSLLQYPRSTTIIETLLDAGFNHDQRVRHELSQRYGEEEMTLLCFAIAQPRKLVSTSVIKVLLDRGANVNAVTSVSKMTPLMLATRKARRDIVDALLLDGAKVDVVDVVGRTPLSITTEVGGDVSVAMMSSILGAAPTNDDGSLHNAAGQLNLSAVQILIKKGHHPDFPSPLHSGRSALAEVCLNGADQKEITAETENEMLKVMRFLIDAGSDVKVKSEGKTMLHLCFEARDPLRTTRAFLKAGIWEVVNKPFQNYVKDGYTYSPTMYILKVLPPTDHREALLTVLRRHNRAIDVYYANDGPQPEDAIGLPEDIQLQDRERKAREQRRAHEDEDFSRTLAHQREFARVEDEISTHRYMREDRRKQELAAQEFRDLRAKAQLQDELEATSHQRRIANERALQDSALARVRALGAAELGHEDHRQRQALQWDSQLAQQQLANERTLSALRVSERDEMERFQSAADQRTMRRIEQQKKLVEGQERLARQLASGGYGTDQRRQIGFVEDLG